MEEVKNTKGSRERMINIAIAVNALLIILLIVGVIVFAAIDKKRSKVILDGSEIKKGTSMFLNADGKTYVAMEDLLQYPGFKMYKINSGRYDSKKTDKESYYVDSIYEAVQFGQEDDHIVKYIKYEYLDRELNPDGTLVLTKEEEQQKKEPKPREKTKIDDMISNQEVFKLQAPVKKANNKRYLTLEDAKYTFNVRFTEMGNTIKIDTIPYIEKQLAGYLKKENLLLNGNYQNRRAVVDGYIPVVLNGKNGFNGVVPEASRIDNVIAIQYDEVRYAQDTKNVYCLKDDKIGIINAQTKQSIIELGDYDKLEVYDITKGVYKVSKNKKYGILDSKGNIIVPIECEEIGYDVSAFDDETDGKVLPGGLIPIKKEGLWGFYNIDGDSSRIVPPKFKQLGFEKLKFIQKDQYGQYTLSENERQELEDKGIKLGFDITQSQLKEYGFTENRDEITRGENTLIVPAETGFEGVIVKTVDEKYGIVSSQNKASFALPPFADKIYKYTENGVKNYYVQYGNVTEQLRKGVNLTAIQNKAEADAQKPKQQQSQSQTNQSTSSTSSTTTQTKPQQNTNQTRPQQNTRPTNQTTNTQQQTTQNTGRNTTTSTTTPSRNTSTNQGQQSGNRTTSTTSTSTQQTTQTQHR